MSLTEPDDLALAGRWRARVPPALFVGVFLGLLLSFSAVSDVAARSPNRGPAFAPKPTPRPQTTAVATFGGAGSATADNRATGVRTQAGTGAGASLAIGSIVPRNDVNAGAGTIPYAGATVAPVEASAPVAAANEGRYGDRAGQAGLDDALPLSPRSGEVGFMLLDLDSEEILSRHAPDAALIPASVSKAPTALYALEALGEDFTFKTDLVASGAIDHGVLLGDLTLVGGGDPTLDSKDLATLAQALKDAGIVRVEGRFLYDTGDTPGFERIASGQPPQAPYNPGYSGLNLNFNRVLAEWKRDAAAGIVFMLSARAGSWSPPADVISAEASPAGGPGFESRQLSRHIGPGLSAETIEHWRVAEHLLGRKGARWLPVRRPARYAAGAFAGIAAELGVELPRPEAGRAPAKSALVARVESKPLSAILRGMLKHSTNVTAEAVGIAASRARGVLFKDPVDITASGQAMSDWLTERFDLDGSDAEPLHIVNHSGLSTDSRVSARGMVKLLARAAKDPKLGPAFIDLLPSDGVRGAKPKAKKQKAKAAVTLAKTGTIFYGRALAGYLECQSGQRYAFAIMSSDLDARSAFDASFDPGATGAPRAARRWLGRARSVERKLLSGWTDRFCG